MLSFAEDRKSNLNSTMSDASSTLMILCNGVRADGSPFWAYMCIKPNNAKAFREARSHGTMNLEDYGTVLEWGDGIAPSKEVQERMERDFGMNHRFEEELLRAINQHN